MAKALFGMGGGAPRMTSNGSPGGVRPMPRPAAGVAAAAGAGGNRPLSDYLGPRGSDLRTDMALEMLKAAMASAQGTNSPVLQFLTPVIGSMMGARAERLRSDARAAEVSAMTESVLGPNGMSPAAKRALDVMNNENAPDYLRAIAKKQFDAAMVPIDSAPVRRGGSGGAAPPADKPAPRPRVYGSPFELNGILHQRDAYGNAVPMLGPDGQPVPAKRSPAAVPPGAASPDDPLGLRTPAPDNPLELP